MAHRRHAAVARARLPALTVRRFVWIVLGALVLTLASSAVTGTRMEVQDWDCPPAPASCARPVHVIGFPLSYISDFHGISPVGSADLVGALLGEDLFRADAFALDLAFFAAVILALDVGRRRLARR